MADVLDQELFRKNCEEFFKAEQVRNQNIQDGIAYTQIYSSMVAVLVQEYLTKGWGPVDEVAMSSIIDKAKVVAKLHYKVANATL